MRKSHKSRDEVLTELSRILKKANKLKEKGLPTLGGEHHYRKKVPFREGWQQLGEPRYCEQELSANRDRGHRTQRGAERTVSEPPIPSARIAALIQVESATADGFSG
jgi:hypothetical protein